MEEGQAIESRMVSRRISAAQKKVEERNFDSRKHLLEYDEVMDHQRKEVYGYRQRILEGTNCKRLILGMFDKQIDLAVKRFLDPDYGAESFAQFAANRLGEEYDAAEFSRSDFAEADKTARDKASRAVNTYLQGAVEENLGADDAREWNWQALAHQINTRYGLKTTDRQLKAIGKEHLIEQLAPEANKSIDALDLTEGQAFLQPDWGVKSLCDWARLKYGIKLTPQELADKGEAEVAQLLQERVRALYQQKEIEFPVITGMARFMSERGGAMSGGQRYDREGLYRWARDRFPSYRDKLREEDFHTQSRNRLKEILLEASKASYPAKPQELIDARIEETFEGARRPSDHEDARELADWARAELGLEVNEKDLTGLPPDDAAGVLWNAYDLRYRPEMRPMERSLVLMQLDTSWKNHLYTMDHLRSGIGLVGYAQEDPKTVYKQEGMKEFRVMWDGVEDKVTEMVFRMEESEAFEESIWTIGATTKDAAPTLQAQAAAQQGIASGGEPKVTGPIRNRGQKVGRNDPCPCGSGKKYKNCHMRQAV
jgi:preprotein translocase subunit SecA